MCPPFSFPARVAGVVPWSVAVRWGDLADRRRLARAPSVVVLAVLSRRRPPPRKARRRHRLGGASTSTKAWVIFSTASSVGYATAQCVGGLCLVFLIDDQDGFISGGEVRSAYRTTVAIS